MGVRCLQGDLPHSTFLPHFLMSLQVTFVNPDWDEFIAKAMVEICQALGVHFAASKPRCELYKLLLYETGSQ